MAFHSIRDLENFLIGSSTAVAMSNAPHANEHNNEYPFYPFGLRFLQSTFTFPASLFVYYSPQTRMVNDMIDDSGDDTETKESSQIPDFATALVETKKNTKLNLSLGWELCSQEPVYVLKKPIAWLQILEQKSRYVRDPDDSEAKHLSTFTGIHDLAADQLLTQVQHCFSQYGPHGQDTVIGFVAIGTVWAWALFFKEFTAPAPTHVDPDYNSKKEPDHKRSNVLETAPEVTKFMEMHKKHKRGSKAKVKFYEPRWSSFVCEGTDEACTEKERVKNCMAEVFPQELARLQEMGHRAVDVLIGELSKFSQASVAAVAH